MSVLLEFIKDSLVTALCTYGLVTLLTVVQPSFGSAANLWPVVPAMFVIQLGLKLIFGRDPDGRLRHISKV